MGGGYNIVQPVHPHTRGEHMSLISGAVSLGGSSPHPWGTHDHGNDAGGYFRFIPTPVGNTARPRPDVKALAVHPHTRGEHPTTPHRPKPSGGSSPHPWGTHRHAFFVAFQFRFIPTPVGNTLTAEFLEGIQAVHPHTRGEHLGNWHRQRIIDGSSPHPWGTPLQGIRLFGTQRFIPTPVGNTWP